jgi:glycosyltransferase involved in cell wall biosynthesis
MLEPAIKHILSIPKRKTEIIIVDDGSTDGTTALALEYAKQNTEVEIRVVTREKNSGKGGAVRHGMLHSRGKRLLMVDADGASRFGDLELLWTALDELDGKSPDHAAIAVGSRAHLVKSEAVVKVPLLEPSAPFKADPNTALVPPEHVDVRIPHDSPCPGGRPHSRYPMRIQTFHKKCCTKNIS